MEKHSLSHWPTAGAPTAPGPAQNEPVVLVLEDEPINLMYLTKLLARYPLQVHTARDQDEARRLMHNQPDIQLALLDIQIGPHCTAGIELIQEWRAQYPNTSTRFVAVSGYNRSCPESDLFAVGFHDLLDKPFTPDALAALLQRHLNTSQVN